MAKIQTRKSVSIPGAFYDLVQAFCEEKGISMAQLSECGIRAVIDGRISLPPASRAPKPEPLRKREIVVSKEPVLHPIRRPIPPPKDPASISTPTISLAPFCAVCTGEVDDKAEQSPLGRDGALVTVCSTCANLHPADAKGRYDVGNMGSARAGVGDGNRHSVTPGRYR